MTKMCSPLIIAILVVIASASATDHTGEVDCAEYKDYLSKLIEKFLEKLRSHMHDGIPSMGVPPLDPLQVPDEDVRIKRIHQYDLSGRISNSKLEGLKEFNVTSLATSLLHMQANITVFLPHLFLTGSYNLKGTALGIIPLRGAGPYIVKPSDITTSVYTTLHIENSHVLMKSIDFSISIDSLFARFEGLFGGGHFGNLANSLMNRFGLTLFRRIEPKIHDQLRTALLTQINAILKDIPLSDLIGMINQPRCRTIINELLK